MPNNDAHTRTKVLVEPADLLGFRIDGRYTLEAVLGEGGMGVVYRTRQEAIGRDVALKILKPGQLNSGRRLERFEREIAIISGLSHPNIVRVFDTGQDPELMLHYIAMELVNGVSLDAILAGHQFRVELALEVVYQICGALTEPHAQGIVHRDIKPENALVVAMADETLQIKVLDFGIARPRAGDSRVTTTGVVIGTPRYMAPESVQGGEIDSRTDLYALGVLLYEMLVGETPFSADTPVATMIQHVTSQVPDLGEALLGFEYAEISKLAADLMAKDPADRPPTARAVRSRIDEIRDSYGFERVKTIVADTPLGSLEPWLIERDQPASGPRLTASDKWSDVNSFELTRRLKEEGDRSTDTDSGKLIAIPAAVAQKHFSAQGRSVDEFESVEDTAEAADWARADTEAHDVSRHTIQRGTSKFVVATIAVVVIALGAMVTWTMTRSTDVAHDTVELGSAVKTEVPETPEVEPRSLQLEEVDMAVSELARARGLAIVDASFDAARDFESLGKSGSVPEGAQPEETRESGAHEDPSQIEGDRPEPPPTDDGHPVDAGESKESGKDDFEKGLEWLRGE